MLEGMYSLSPSISARIWNHYSRLHPQWLFFERLITIWKAENSMRTILPAIQILYRWINFGKCSAVWEKSKPGSLCSKITSNISLFVAHTSSPKPTSSIMYSAPIMPNTVWNWNPRFHKPHSYICLLHGISVTINAKEEWLSCSARNDICISATRNWASYFAVWSDWKIHSSSRTGTPTAWMNWFWKL